MIIFLIASGGFFSILISFTLLTAKENTEKNYTGFLMYFLYGVCIISNFQYRPGTEYITPHLLYVNYPLAFFIGPVLFMYFRTLTSYNIRFNFKYLLLFIPGLLVFIFFLPFYIQSAEMKLILYPLTAGKDPFIRTGYAVINYFLLIWVMFCFILSFKYTYFLWNRKALAHFKLIRTVIIYIILWIILIAFIIFSQIIKSLELYRAGFIIADILIIASFFNTQLYPDFFNLLKKETSSVKYTNSQIKGLNVEAVLERLDDLMKYEKIYTDEDLTLKKLSCILKISPHQLSEIINKNYKSSFNSYINNFRVSDAEEQLKENTKDNILTIAFSCGFNSKTTFNRAFVKRTGVTPSAYREKFFKKNRY